MATSIHLLQQTLRDRAKEFQVLRQITEAINSTLELQAVLQQILDLVSEVTASDA